MNKLVRSPYRTSSLLCLCHCLRPVPEAGGCDSTLRQAVHHGREAGPAELRSIRLAGETGAADQKIPADGGDRLPGPWHEGESAVLLWRIFNLSM